MKHLLLIGVGPLPFYESDHLYGFGIRAWQFAQPLLDAGHRITLVTCEFGVHRESSIQIKYRSDPTQWAALEHFPVPQPGPRNTNLILTRIEELIRTQRPDAVIAAGSTIATNLAACLNTDLPIWMDMFGDLFAEVQAKTPFTNAEAEIDFFHQTLTRVLLRGDRFSTVSEMQRGAAVGQLGLMGRLNQYTLGEELVHTIPCAFNGKISPVRGESYLRGKKLGSKEFLLLCSGGFNTWTDVDSLFDGIERAMEKERRIHCVVTGGGITGHHEDGFKRFRGLIGKSPYENRFHLLGWLSNQEVEQVTLECDLGLNVDLPVYESLLGSRNRMLFWLQCGLPILTTVTTEISHILTEKDLALGVPPQEPRKLAEKIVEAAQHPIEQKQRAVRAKRFGYDYLTFTETARPLVKWASHPVQSGDNIERALRKGQPFSKVDALWQSWGFPEEGKGRDPSIPRPPRAVIKTRPQGKNWWRRLLGA
ncbi:MAG: glycosyltransferase [Candidatus Omnitrophica bacterium]|nr:glycosyltransferase [Candidatus Omnitrophota bacterium]